MVRSDEAIHEPEATAGENVQDQATGAESNSRNRSLLKKSRTASLSPPHHSRKRGDVDESPE